MCKKHKMMRKISKFLVIIGGLNWGLIGVGAFMAKDWNIVHKSLGSMPRIEAVVYILVGLAALKMMIHHCKHGMMKCGCECGKCQSCEMGGMEEKKMM